MNKTIKKIININSWIASLPYKKSSFSQCGEDILIGHIFLLRNIKKPSYLDIGANHPFFLNNTFLFYRRGSKGINVEANSLLIKSFNRHRPNDINLDVGIGHGNGTLDFFIFTDNTLSTFSKEEAEHLKGSGHTISKIEKVRIRSLNQIITDTCGGVFPDLLTIDVEGQDFEILKSTDFSKSKPKVICAETSEFSNTGAGAKRTDYIQYILGLGYSLYADTYLNSIFVENGFWTAHKT